MSGVKWPPAQYAHTYAMPWHSPCIANLSFTASWAVFQYWFSTLTYIRMSTSSSSSFRKGHKKKLRVLTFGDVWGQISLPWYAGELCLSGAQTRFGWNFLARSVSCYSSMDCDAFSDGFSVHWIGRWGPIAWLPWSDLMLMTVPCGSMSDISGFTGQMIILDNLR